MGKQSFDASNELESNRSNTLPLIWWFAVALVPMVASQIMRLHQHQAAGRLFLDYAGRITALATLAVVPSARVAASSLLMLMFRRSGALWPVGLAHYLVDLIAFA